MQQHRSSVAVFSAWAGVGALGAVALGPLSIHIGLLAPLDGFRLFLAGAVLGMGVALVTGIVGLVRTRASTGRGGRRQAWIGLGVGSGLLALLLVTAAPGGSVPAIHDITTDFEDPPAFSDALRDLPDRQNGVDYPDGGAVVPDLQRSAYPDLASFQVNLPPAEAMLQSRHSAELLGWKITSADGTSGRLEAQDVSAVFCFVDDVVVRIRLSASGSRVDLRSNSRVGRSDLGANAKRIRAFRELLKSMQ